MRGAKEFLYYRAKLELVLEASPQFILGGSYLVLFINFKVKIFICFPRPPTPRITPGKATEGGSDLNVDAKTKVWRIRFKTYYTLVFLYRGIHA